MTVKKKRNPQDATMRNIRATRTAICAIKVAVRRLDLRVQILEAWEVAGRVKAAEAAAAECK